MQAAFSVSPQSFTDFGGLLRYLRERAELSQRELALQVGYHYSYMSRIEKNKRIPDAATLMARFVPALDLDGEPQWTARLLELARAFQAKSREAASASEAAGPGRTPAIPPPTALPIFDLSGGLPRILTPLLGRDGEVETLGSLLIRDDVRLVSLIGPPGVGKTRLAAHMAAQMAGTFAHGALFVDLSPVTDVNAFMPALAEALGARETPDTPLVQSVAAALHQRNVLLVLDNFEHVIDAAPDILPLLIGSPDLKILATSREALRVSGEYEFPISPLSLPEDVPSTAKLPGEAPVMIQDLLHFASVRLFVERAQAVQPAFTLTSENALAVVEICRHLDGLPLAIELAAARVKTLSPEAMLPQLDHRFDWLTRGSRDASASRQTLRGTLEWSYNLLSEPERTLLRRLAVFAGGWTLRAAESVCADPVGPEGQEGLHREQILDLLVQLVDKSLVVAAARTGQARYHMLETMREFSRGELIRAGELDRMLDRHLAHFAEYAEDAEDHLDGTEQTRWISFSEQEHNNFRAALDHSLLPGANITDGLRIGAAISLFWIERSHFHEGIERLRLLLGRADGPGHARLKARMLYRSAAMHMRISEYRAAHDLCAQSIEISRELGDRRSLASALFYMGDINLALNDLPSARSCLEESVSICSEISFSQQLNMALTSLGRVLDQQGEFERASALMEQALSIAGRIDDTWGLSYALQWLGSINRRRGALDIAIDYFERSLPVIRLVGDRLAEGITLANLAILYNLQEKFAASGRAAEQAFAAFQSIGNELEQPFPLRMIGYSAIHAGNIVQARALITESLKGNRAQGHNAGQLACLIALASCELAEGNAAKAVTSAAFAENRVRTESLSLLEPDAAALSHILAAGKAKLGEKAFEQACRHGGAFDMEELLALASPRPPA